MLLCHVDADRSPTFKSLVASLRKRFRHIDDDLREIWPDIAQDYRNARGAESIPGFANTVYKYRAKCSDSNKGSRGGYRVIGYYHQEANTLYPIYIYSKLDQSDVSAKTVTATVKELTQMSLDIPPQ